MVNLLYGLPEDLQHKINWMNIHDEIKTLVSQRQSGVVRRSRDGTTNTTYVHDPAQPGTNPLALEWQALGEDTSRADPEWPNWLELEYFLDSIEWIKRNHPLEYEKYVYEKHYWEPQWA